MRDKKGLIFLGIVSTMAVIASSAHWWIPQFLKFVGTNSDLIQGLTDFIQILLWVVLLSIFIGKLYLRKIGEKSTEQNKTLNFASRYESDKNSSNPENQGNKYSVEAQNITGFVQGEGNRVTNHFKDTSSGD